MHSGEPKDHEVCAQDDNHEPPFSIWSQSAPLALRPSANRLNCCVYNNHGGLGFQLVLQV